MGVRRRGKTTVLSCLCSVLDRGQLCLEQRGGQGRSEGGGDEGGVVVEGVLAWAPPHALDGAVDRQPARWRFEQESEGGDWRAGEGGEGACVCVRMRGRGRNHDRGGVRGRERDRERDCVSVLVLQCYVWVSAAAMFLPFCEEVAEPR